MVVIRMGIVNDLVKAGRPKTAKELSESCGGEEMLISTFFWYPRYKADQAADLAHSSTDAATRCLRCFP